MSYVLEPMSEPHRAGVIDIFNHYIENSFAAFQEKAVPKEFFNRFIEMTRGYPAFVALGDTGDIVAFAFLRPYHPAPTLRRTAEIGYFILPAHTRQGLGSTFLARLMEDGRAMGVDNLVASISSHNEPSLAFHRTHGFAECGRFRAVGRKFDRDFDVIWMQRRI